MLLFYLFVPTSCVISSTRSKVLLLHPDNPRDRWKNYTRGNPRLAGGCGSRKKGARLTFAWNGKAGNIYRSSKFNNPRNDSSPSPSPSPVFFPSLPATPRITRVQLSPDIILSAFNESPPLSSPSLPPIITSVEPRTYHRPVTNYTTGSINDRRPISARLPPINNILVVPISSSQLRISLLFCTLPRREGDDDSSNLEGGGEG